MPSFYMRALGLRLSCFHPMGSYPPSNLPIPFPFFFQIEGMEFVETEQSIRDCLGSVQVVLASEPRFTSLCTAGQGIREESRSFPAVRCLPRILPQHAYFQRSALGLVLDGDSGVVSWDAHPIQRELSEIGFSRSHVSCHWVPRHKGIRPRSLRGTSCSCEGLCIHISTASTMALCCHGR